MFTKFKKRNKIYQSYEDSRNKKDLRNPKNTQLKYLTIDDFNSRGEVANARAPCVITTIDREYIKNASLQRRARKFRIKTDILTLREITRKKFLIYATQQRYLDKQRETACQEQIYKIITESQEFAIAALQKCESRAFTEMNQTQQQLKNLTKNTSLEESQKEIAEHQRVLLEVQELYGRFLLLLKLRRYFGEIVAPASIDDVEETAKFILPQLTEIVDLQINKRTLTESKKESYVTSYMNKVVRPYLAKRNDLKGDIWIKGYEIIRQKIFNYYRRFNQFALLNHLVAIVHEKSEKTFGRSMIQPKFLKDPQYLKIRTEFLSHRSSEILDDFIRSLKKDLIQIKLNAYLPVIVDNIDTNLLQNNKNITEHVSKNYTKTSYNNASSPTFNKLYKPSYNTILEKVEKLQWYFMCLLQDLEKSGSDQYSKMEKIVRKRIQDRKEMARHLLVKQYRVQNWMIHFRKHAVLHQ